MMTKLVEGSREQVSRGTAEGTGRVQSGEKETEGRPYHSLQLLERGCSKVSVNFFSQIASNRMRGNGLKLC